MSLTMRRRDWDRLFEDHPELVEDGTTDLSPYWMYDPMSVALARMVAVWRRDVAGPFWGWRGGMMAEVPRMVARRPVYWLVVVPAVMVAVVVAVGTLTGWE